MNDKEDGVATNTEGQEEKSGCDPADVDEQPKDPQGPDKFPPELARARSEGLGADTWRPERARTATDVDQGCPQPDQIKCGRLDGVLVLYRPCDLTVWAFYRNEDSSIQIKDTGCNAVPYSDIQTLINFLVQAKKEGHGQTTQYNPPPSAAGGPEGAETLTPAADTDVEETPKARRNYK